MPMPKKTPVKKASRIRAESSRRADEAARSKLRRPYPQRTLEEALKIPQAIR